jgi:hypothetical protein
LTTSTVDGEEPPLKRRLRRMIDLRGLEPVARELGLGREALARYLAGIHVQAGTFKLIEDRLAKLDAEPEPRSCPRCKSTSPSVRCVVKVGTVQAACAHDWHELAVRPREQGGSGALPR